MEGQCECLRYLVEHLLAEKYHHQLLGLCPTNRPTTPHPVLEVSNNLGQSPRMLAQHFYKYDTVKTIDQLLTQFRTSPNNSGKLNTFPRVTLYNALDCRTNELYRTPNHCPFVC